MKRINIPSVAIHNLERKRFDIPSVAMYPVAMYPVAAISASVHRPASSDPRPLIDAGHASPPAIPTSPPAENGRSALTRARTPWSTDLRISGVRGAGPIPRIAARARSRRNLGVKNVIAARARSHRKTAVPAGCNPGESQCGVQYVVIKRALPEP